MARMKLIKKYVPVNAKILDIGCGNGNFLLQLKENRYENIKGIDPDKASVEVVKSRGIDAQIGNIFDIKSENEKYDVVCCTEVLEHIYDLKGCIEKLKARLRGRGARIYVDVPGMEGINEKLAMPAEHFNCEHINYFTFRSLDNLFRMGGFKRVSEKDDYCLFLEKKSSPILVIGGIYELDEAGNEGITKDAEGAAQIIQYFRTIEEKVAQKNELLRKVLREEERVVIWGGGNYAFQMLSSVPEVKEKIDFFIDSNHSKHGRKIAGKVVRGVDDMPKDGTLILICSMNYAGEMALECKKRNVRYYIY